MVQNSQFANATHDKKREKRRILIPKNTFGHSLANINMDTQKLTFYCVECTTLLKVILCLFVLHMWCNCYDMAQLYVKFL